MKMYFAGADGDLEILSKYKAKILISYAVKNIIVRKKVQNKFDDIFLDSGAFTSYNTGKIIDINEYIDFIKKYKFKTYAGLDVIGKDKESFDNYQYMYSNNLKDTIPTFHFGGNFEYLHLYLKQSKYVALGGVAQLKQSKKLIYFLDKCFEIIKDYFPIKIHGFGIGNSTLLKRYPFYSVDSTTWQAGRRFNEFNDFDNYGNCKRVMNFNRAKKENMTIQNFTHNKKTPKQKVEKSIQSFIKQENYITKLWEKRGIKLAS